MLVGLVWMHGAQGLLSSQQLKRGSSKEGEKTQPYLSPGQAPAYPWPRAGSESSFSRTVLERKSTRRSKGHFSRPQKSQAGAGIPLPAPNTPSP